MACLGAQKLVGRVGNCKFLMAALAFSGPGDSGPLPNWQNRW